MITQLFKKQKELTFERTYAAPIATVWDAWTNPDMLRQWWGVKNTFVPECDVDLRVGGRIWIVMEAGEAMGKYAGTRWPLDATFTAVDDQRRLAWDGQSLTEGDDDAFVKHVAEMTLEADGDKTTVRLHITITEVGPGAKFAVMGMKMGWKAYLDKLEALLTD